MNKTQKKLLRSAVIACAISLIFLYIANRYVELVMQSPYPFGENFSEAFNNLAPSLLQHPFYFSMDSLALLAGILMFLTIWILWAKYFAFSGNYRAGEESGSATWGMEKEGIVFKDNENPFNNILFTERYGLAVRRDTPLPPAERIKLERNWNNLVIGGSGSGKTFSYVTPNLLQLYGNYFLTDPKGDLLPKMGQFFVDNGYNVKSFNTIDFGQSLHYNPLAYVKTDADILSFVNCLIKNTTPSDASKGDPFWEKSETLLYVSLIALLRDWFPKEDYSLSGLITLLDMAEAREEDENFKSPLDLLFKQIEDGGKWRKREGESENNKKSSGGFSRKIRKTDKSRLEWIPSRYKHNTTGIKPADVGGMTTDDDFALANYNAFKVAAGKTLKSIIISCNVRLKPLAIREVRELLTYDEMQLDTLGDPDRKTAVFAILSDTDKTFSFLFAIMMWQSIDLLCRKALLAYGGKLPTHVQFIFDEFANIGTIPDIEETIAVVRSRNIGIDVILQSVAQLESRYDKAAKTIIDCCDSTLFLGGKSNSTNKEISEMIGKETIHQVTYNQTHGQSGSSTKNMQIQGRDLIDAAEIGKMDRTESLLLIAGVNPFRDKKYPTLNHPRWETAQADKPFNFMDYWKGQKKTKKTKSVRNIEAKER